MKTKKLIVASLIFAAILMISVFTNSVIAESLGYLTVTTDRKVGDVTYKHQLYSDNTAQTKNVWKLVTCTVDENGKAKDITNTIPDLYCLRAGLGFTSGSMDNTAVEYSQSYEMIKDYARIVEYFSGITSETTIFDETNSDKFNAVMWVLDNMLLEDATDDEINEYLTKYEIYSNEELADANQKVKVLTKADIEAIQQLVIWYYTNNDEEFYNNDVLPSILISIGEGDPISFDGYKTFSDRYDDPIIYGGSYGTERQTRARALYAKLIERANAAATAVAALGENETYKPLRDITIFLAGTDAAAEQPVVRVKEAVKPDVTVRKFVSAVNGVPLEGENSRAPKYDTSKLNQIIDGKLQTTAIYNQKKEPQNVSIGDTVTYTLRIYNEGEVATYIKEITDYLPKYLQYEAYGDDDLTWWELDPETGRIAKSTEYCIVTGASDDLIQEVGKPLGEVLIPAAKYDRDNNKYELNYVDIQISCKVLTNTPYETKVTNIAQVTAIENQNGRAIETDRDSTPNGGFTLPADTDSTGENKDLSHYTGGKDGEQCFDGTNVIKEDGNEYYPGQEDDDDFESIIVEKPVVDLAVRKFISAVGDTQYDRAPSVDTSPLKQGQKTATYIHSKKPVPVEIGDVITYTLRIYNESDVNARASQIKDHISKNLKYVSFGNDTDGNWWTTQEGEKYNTLTSTENIVVTGYGEVGAGARNTARTDAIEKLSDAIIPAYNKTNDILSYVDVEVHCQVLPVEETTKLTNVAEISGMADEYGTPIDEDRDSAPDNVEKDIPEDFQGYKDNEIDKPYVPGNEDDDDFEKAIVIIPEPDLALIKFISKVGEEELKGDNSRVPTYDTTSLDNHTGTTAKYNTSKNPISIGKGNLVTFTLRVYNEGDLNAYASKITDYLPEGLIYLADNETNKKYDWKYHENTREITTTIASNNNSIGEEVYSSRNNGRLLSKYEGNGVLDYIDVEVVCKVDENAIGNSILTNLAQVTEIKNEDGRVIEKDKDSTPDGEFDLPDEKDRPTYSEQQEDDDDFDKVLVKPDFDLSLRKFITKVGTTSVNNRYPEVSYVDGKFVYNQTKNPLSVVTGDTVIFTIRAYNEGEAAGYANEITDNVPEGLEFLPENEINKTYRWKLLDAEQKETTDVTKAKYIITDYLSEEQEREAGRINVIKAFDKTAEVTETNPDFKDVQIAFKVVYTAKTTNEAERTIINTAQISKSSDDDIDSNPDRDEVYNHEDKEKNEDDIDIDSVKVKYFDLSLLKWTSQTRVTLNGKTTVTDTGITAETAKNENPVKLEVKESQIKKINIKYVYTIRVTNDGEIEGYAKEITDYIPEGLKFEQEDNPDWYVIEGNKIGTKKIENTLLKPGESAEVQVILTWINGKDNFGQKINLAEISEDYNKEEVPDIDSTPDNQVPDEDDIDDAPVIVTIKTGVEQIYVGLILIIFVTFAGGVGLIKKYVLE